MSSDRLNPGVNRSVDAGTLARRRSARSGQPLSGMVRLGWTGAASGRIRLTAVPVA